MNLQKQLWSLRIYSKITCKGKKIWHWNLEFGHSKGEIKILKIPKKNAGCALEKSASQSQV
jgi:hypothetical protein